jgi:NADP-reducing hydrogenase subunit HndC
MDSPYRFRIYVCGNVHCSARGRDSLLNRLDNELWYHQLSADVQVIVSGCQNRCELGPNLTVWPGPFRYVNLSPDIITRIVVEHLVGGQPVLEFLHDS